MKPYYYPFIDPICFELIESLLFIIFYDVHKSNQFNGLINWLKVIVTIAIPTTPTGFLIVLRIYFLIVCRGNSLLDIRYQKMKKGPSSSLLEKKKPNREHNGASERKSST